jgi:hypothetical protein
MSLFDWFGGDQVVSVKTVDRKPVLPGSRIPKRKAANRSKLAARVLPVLALLLTSGAGEVYVRSVPVEPAEPIDKAVGVESPKPVVVTHNTNSVVHPISHSSISIQAADSPPPIVAIPTAARLCGSDRIEGTARVTDKTGAHNQSSGQSYRSNHVF